VLHAPIGSNQALQDCFSIDSGVLNESKQQRNTNPQISQKINFVLELFPLHNPIISAGCFNPLSANSMFFPIGLFA
jgi:hypothetical protein